MGSEVGHREGILALVAARPGASTRELAARLGLCESSLDYHLRRLRSEGALVSETQGRTVAWFTAGHGLCPVLRKLVPLMRRGDVRAIALATSDTPRGAAALSQATGLSAGCARWSLELLHEAGALERTRTGRALLGEGAETCLAKALAQERCDKWGACAVSRRLTASREPSATAAAPDRSTGPRRAPSSG